jgi:hypothetical protein
VFADGPGRLAPIARPHARDEQRAAHVVTDANLTC